MESILDIISEKKASLPRKQRMVAEYMEKNPQVMSYITLRELSSSLEVTEITVLKTCQSLGFDGFNELKYEFRKNSIAKYWMRKIFTLRVFRSMSRRTSGSS